MSITHRIVNVEVPPRAYPVVIGAGVLAELGPRLAACVKARRTLVVSDTNVAPFYGPGVLEGLAAAGFEASLLTLPAGEATKSLTNAERIYTELAACKIDRACPVVSLGGGVIGDLTGFAAATWMRGIPFVQCSTTLEADVDASVGGKTAVNHASGKNMIGAFYQPLMVLIDTGCLGTLSRRDYLAGLAESVKHAVILDADFFSWHEAHADEVAAGRPELMPELIERNVRIKAKVVADDERETTGLRALLNYGHTVGHAIELLMARAGEPWRHGEAVAAGSVAAAEISVAAGLLGRSDAERIVSLLSKLGLPTTAPLAGQRQAIHELMSLDKKVAAGKLRFALPEGIGRAALHDDVRPEWVEQGLDRVLR